MYDKRCIGVVLIRKAALPGNWVRWTHHMEGKTHCEVCLKLDGCWFLRSKTPPWPHHPFCHCTLDPIDDALVLANAVSVSAYSKFDPYLFNPFGSYTHQKEKLFRMWGYTVEDARWLQGEMERQALEKYISGDYELGKLDEYGQRLNILIEIPTKNGEKIVTFISGWMIEPNGTIRLNTPYGGK